MLPVIIMIIKHTYTFRIIKSLLTDKFKVYSQNEQAVTLFEVVL